MAGKQELELFKAALGNPNHISTINDHISSQLHFINTVQDNSFTPWDILELIECCNDPQVRSLLIIVLFTQENFFNNLPKESILDQLSRDEPPSPSRINYWIQQLDTRVLTEQHLKNILPEAAVSLLVSISHFHVLDEPVIQLLFSKYLRSDLLKYWLKHYALMPNAHLVLGHIVKFLYNEVFDLLNNQLKNESTLPVLYMRMIEHLNLFPKFIRFFIKLKLKESHLEYAMKLYLNGHFYEIYPQLIGALAQQLAGISRSIMQLFFRLQGNQYLTEILKKKQLSVYQYIQETAEQGSTSLWFEQGELQPHLLLAQMRFPDHEYAMVPLPELFSNLPHVHQSISLFEYYLNFYKGSPKNLESLLREVLRLKQCKQHFFENLTLWLDNPLVSALTKSAIHRTFIEYAHEAPPEALYRLFNYDGINTLQYYGMQGGTSNFLKLFTCCQKLLQSPLTEAQKQMVLRAQLEARLELTLHNYHGLFGALFKRFMRCYYYGWSGFFFPQPNAFTHPHKIISPPNFEEVLIPKKPSLAELLINRPETLNTEYLNQIILKLEEENLKNPMPHEYQIRKEIHQIIQIITQNDEMDAALRNWYNTHQVSCTRNLIRLVEITFLEGSLSDVQALLGESPEGSNQIKRLKDELFPKPISMKPQPPELITEPEESNELMGELISAFNKVSSIATKTLTSVGNAIPWSFWQTSPEKKPAPLPLPENHYN